MKKKILLGGITIIAGMLFTFFVLNKEGIYAKEEYLVYAFQVGAYEKYDNAVSYAEMLPTSLIIEEDNLYKVYSAICKDIDIVNRMLVYFENNEINIYLKSLSVSKEFFYSLDKFEELIKNSNDTNIFDQVNQSILDLYVESKENE